MAFVVFAGQSNTGGYAMSAGSLTTPWVPDANILIWNPAANAFETMQPGRNTGYGPLPNTWGPEVQFAREFRAAHPGEVLRIVKFAEGGTGLAKDSGLYVSDWSPNSDGELFDRARDMISNARAAAGGPAVDAVFFGQGEEDAATYGKSHDYAQNLPVLFTAIRAEWMNNPAGHIGYFQINTNSPYAGEVRAAQASVDAADPNAVSFDADPFPRQSDPLHYSAAGYDGIGAAEYRVYAGWSASGGGSGGGGGGSGGGGGAQPGLDPATAQATVNILRTPGDQALAARVAQHTMTADAALNVLVQVADSTTSVATLSYQFFTGRMPSAAGLDYLVSPTGPNPNNLNSAYYQSFSLENRYINFAVNLGKYGEGRAAFEATYGGKSLFEATRSAYATIFGEAPSDAKLHALLDPTANLGAITVTRAQYFALYGQDGEEGLGAKAAMVGWLLAEAVKADVGMYAHANDAFLHDIADGAAYEVSLVGTYGSPSFVYHPG